MPKKNTKKETIKWIFEIDVNLDLRFREAIARRWGIHRGIIKKSLEEAIEMWIKRYGKYSKSHHMQESTESKYYETNFTRLHIEYKNKWIAILGSKVIASDDGVSALYEKVTPFKKTPLILFMGELST